MNAGKYVFAQLLDFLPKHEFNKCRQRYRGDYKVRSFSCFDQFLSMAFAQLTFRDSLRDIETCLRAFQTKLYHVGFRGTMSRSTLADANENRDWRIFADFAQVLIAQARKLYADEELPVALHEAAYAFDSTTIDLCLKLFPWAHFRRRKAAVKLHTLIDLRGNIPCFLRVSTGKMADVQTLDDLLLEAGAFYMMDRGYIDFGRLYRLQQSLAYFVTRAKKNLVYRRVQSRVVDKTLGLRCDQTICLQGTKTTKQYPAPLRRVCYYDVDNDKRLVFLTNNFILPAQLIAQLYKCRWQVELFFKWIKQNLRIKTFVGTSENAVKIQVWIAVCVYVLVAIIKKELRIERRPSEILQILSLTLFEKTPLFQLLDANSTTFEAIKQRNQLMQNDL
jgi:transposase